MPEWAGGRTTLEMIVEELQRPVVLDETFERRVMVRVRRLYAKRRRRGGRALLAAAAIAHRPAWAAALAAGIVAIATVGVLRSRSSERIVAVAGSVEPVTFVFVAPAAQSVAVVGDFNNWGMDGSALVAANHKGVWSVTSTVPAGLHRYAFVVNGNKWVADPTAPRSTADDFGKPSSALVVEDSTK